MHKRLLCSQARQETENLRY